MRIRVSLIGLILLVALGSAVLLVACDGTTSAGPSATGTPADTPTGPPSPLPTATPSPTPSPTTPPAHTPGAGFQGDVPAVSASFPVDHDTALPPNAPVTLVFNRVMDHPSVEAAVSIVPSIPVTMTWASDQHLIIAPAAWPARTTYTVTVTNAARTAAGEPLAQPFVLRFRAALPAEEGRVPIPILMYHALVELKPDANASLIEWSNSPASFAAQMDYLEQHGYTTIGFPALLDYLERNEPLPPKPILITFDDGHRTFPTEALPVLVKHKFKATLFIVTDYPEGKYGAYMHWDAIRAAMEAGVDIGSHAMTHQSLNRMTPAEAEREVDTSKTLFKERLGYDVTVFSYPSGAFNDTVIALVKKAGYRAAVTINPAPWQVRGDSYRLNRIHFPYTSTLADFAKLLP